MPARRKNEAPESEEQTETEVEETVEDKKSRSTSKKPVKKVTKKSAPKKANVRSGKKPMKGGSKTAKKTRTSNKKVSENRYFKLIHEDGSTYGRYTGETPKQAASKGYTKMLQKMKKEGEAIPKSCTIYLRESTRGSPRKIYGYKASRQKLDDPQELKIIDKETGKTKVITYRYRNKIKKVPVDMEQFGGAMKNTKNKKNSNKSSSSKKSSGSSKKASGRSNNKKTSKSSPKKKQQSKSGSKKAPSKKVASKAQSSR